MSVSFPVYSPTRMSSLPSSEVSTEMITAVEAETPSRVPSGKRPCEQRSE